MTRLPHMAYHACKEVHAARVAQRRRRLVLALFVLAVIVGTVLWWKFAPAYVYGATRADERVFVAAVMRGACCVVVGGGVEATAEVK